ncbi:hypothetical protein N310_06064, partial [Acanthisitta chloris]
CNKCQGNFSNQFFLALHQHKHSSHDHILCLCCNQRFIWSTDFIQQHWVHIGLRP